MNPLYHFFSLSRADQTLAFLTLLAVAVMATSTTWFWFTVLN